MNKRNCGDQIRFVFVLRPGYQALISLQSPLLLLPVAITWSESTHSSSSDEPLFLASNLLVVVSISSVLILHYNFVQHAELNFGSRSGKKYLFNSSPLTEYLYPLLQRLLAGQSHYYYYQSFDEMQNQYSVLHGRLHFLRHPQAVTAMCY